MKQINTNHISALPQTNIAREKQQMEDDFPFGRHFFSDFSGAAPSQFKAWPQIL